MITIVAGPMFAGKTTWLVEFTKKLQPGTYLVIKPSMDIRYAADEVVTHNGVRMPAINVDAAQPELPDLNPNITTLLFDELNFFTAETLLPLLREQVRLGREIVGVGLMYDSEKRPFGATLPLFQLADQQIELQANCDECGQKAGHTYRKIESDSQVVLGAAELYGACCQRCWDVLKARATIHQQGGSPAPAYSA